MIRTLYIFLIVLVTACGGNKSKNIYPVFEMKKTSCMGMCPVYEMKVFSDGRVWIDAKENVSLKGEYESALSDEDLTILKEMFNAANFFDFEDSYDSEYSDLPTTFITYNNGEQEKRIKDYFGAPEELKDLEKQLASLIDQLEWKSVD